MNSKYPAYDEYRRNHLAHRPAFLHPPCTRIEYRRNRVRYAARTQIMSMTDDELGEFLTRKTDPVTPAQAEELVLPRPGSMILYSDEGEDDSDSDLVSEPTQKILVRSEGVTK